MRLLVARCEVTYTGRLDAFLPEAVRLLMIKSDGSRARPRRQRRLPAEQLDDAADGDRGVGRADRRPQARRQDRGPARDPDRRGALGPGARDGRDRRAREGRGREAPAGGARRRARMARGRAPARPARVDDRDRPRRPDVPRLRRRLGRGRDQAGRDDRGGRAADALPRLHPRRSGQGGLPRHPRGAVVQAAGGDARRVARARAASRSTWRSCAASASPS